MADDPMICLDGGSDIIIEYPEDFEVEGGAFGGPVQCDAVYDVDVSGFGHYRLTAKNGQAIPISDGTVVEFLPPATAIVGAMYVWVDGANTGFLYSPSGRRATFQDVRAHQPIRMRYQGAVTGRGAGFIIDTPVGSFAHSMAGAHGKFSLTTDFTNGIIRLQGWDGGNGLCLIKDPVSGALRMTDGPIQANIWNGTAWVNGQPNQSAQPNTFYYVYAFMPDGNDIYTRLLDFDQSPPTPNYQGILTKITDDSRTLVAFLYTFDGNISFRTTGARPTLALQNLYNGMLLHMTSDVQVIGGIGAAWVDFPNAACQTTTNAETNLPHFIGHCTATCTNFGDRVQFRLKLTGIDAATGATFTQYSSTRRATISGAGHEDDLAVSFGAALSTGTLIVTPQVRYIVGSGNAECQVFADCYQ